MMSAAVGRLSRPLPRPVVVFVLPLVYLLLTLVFVLFRFPYERVADGLVEQVEDATGVRLDVGQLGPYLSPFGLGFQAREVVAVPRQGGPVEIERLRVRPAWSLSWLRGDPSIYVDAESEAGNVAGAVTLGSAMAYDGSIERLDLAAPAIRAWLPYDGIDGKLTADADLSLVDGLPAGDLRFEIGQGSVALPDSPLAIPFESIRGTLAFGDGSTLRVDSIDVNGPMLDAHASGTAGDGTPGARLEDAALDLSVDLEVKGSMVRSALRNAGVRLDREGKASFKVGGRLGSPRVQ